MMTNWYERRSTKALQFAGLADSSGGAHTRMVRQLVREIGSGFQDTKLLMSFARKKRQNSTMPSCRPPLPP